MLRGRPGPYRHGVMTGVQLDATGELLLSCQAGGDLAVHDVHTLRHRALLNAEARCASRSRLHVEILCRVPSCCWVPNRFHDGHFALWLDGASFFVIHNKGVRDARAGEQECVC